MAPHFSETGYVFVKSLLTSSESAAYRREVETLARDAILKGRSFAYPDGVTQSPQFWRVIWHSRLLENLRTVLGEGFRYTQHSDIHANRTGGWHRDCACREFGRGPDWTNAEEPYRVVRVAIYLQSFAESGSMLGVVPGSHRFEQPLTDQEWRNWIRQKYRATRLTSLFDSFRRPSLRRLPERAMTLWTDPEHKNGACEPSTPVWLKTEPGDCIIFDQRLYHAASPIYGPKFALFLSYSPDNVHARNHLGYYRHFRKDLGYRRVPHELEKELRARNLFLDAPHVSEVDKFLWQLNTPAKR